MRSISFLAYSIFRDIFSIYFFYFTLTPLRGEYGEDRYSCTFEAILYNIDLFHVASLLPGDFYRGQLPFIISPRSWMRLYYWSRLISWYYEARIALKSYHAIVTNFISPSLQDIRRYFTLLICSPSCFHVHAGRHDGHNTNVSRRSRFWLEDLIVFSSIAYFDYHF